MLFGFGAMLASGVLQPLTWTAALVCLALIFVIRPLSGLLAEYRSNLPLAGTLAIAFLGVRGMGSIYYLAYGQNHAEFIQIDLLWACVSFTILVSILVHGVVSGPLISYIERHRGHIHTGTDEEMLSHSPDGKPIAVELPDKPC